MLGNMTFVGLSHVVVWTNKEKKVLEQLVVLAHQGINDRHEVGPDRPFWPGWVAEHHHRRHHRWHRVAVVWPLVRGEIRDGVRLVGRPKKAPH